MKKNSRKWPFRIDLITPKGDHVFIGYSSKWGTPSKNKKTGAVSFRDGAGRRVQDLTKHLPSNWTVQVKLRDIETGEAKKIIRIKGKVEAELFFTKYVEVDVAAKRRAAHARKRQREQRRARWARNSKSFTQGILVG